MVTTMDEQIGRLRAALAGTWLLLATAVFLLSWRWLEIVETFTSQSPGANVTGISARLGLDLFGFAADANAHRWNADAIGENNVVAGLALLKALADFRRRIQQYRPVVAVDNDFPVAEPGVGQVHRAHHCRHAHGTGQNRHVRIARSAH